MPIVNVNLRNQKLPKIGNIRKGIKVPVMTQGQNPRPKKDQQGNVVTRPKEVPYFVFQFDPSDKTSPEIIERAYGKEPDRFNAFLAYRDIDQTWDAWYEAYTFNQMIARSDGAVVTFLRDITNDQKLIVGGQLKEPPQNPESPAGQLVKGLGVGDVLAYYDDMVLAVSGSGKSITFDAVGRLELIIPDLQRYATLTLHTGGRWHDVPHITEMVSRVIEISEAINRPANMIPLIVRRVPYEMSYVGDDGKPHRKEVWNIQIEIAPTIFKGMLEAYQNTPIALLAEAAPTVYEPPEDLSEAETEPLYLTETVPDTDSRPKPFEQVKREAEEAAQERLALKAEGKISNIDSHLIAVLLDLEIFESDFAAKAVMERCAWKSQTIEKFIAWAQVYREWKQLYLSEDMKNKEATTAAIEQTNAGNKVGED